VAQAADQKVEYSKHKGLEYKKCKVLLLDALEDHKRLSREEIDKLWWNLLSDVLTDKQKKTKVGNMLTKMKEERLIVNKTVGNISYWSLLEP
jgi:ATP-dependent DNA helicase RecG